jgi:hypothetical protein
LTIGMRNLKIIAKNRDIKYFHQYDIKENMPLPCISSEQWLTFMPPNSNLIKGLSQKYEKLTDILQ